MSAVELVCTFARAEGDRLLAVERFAIGLPQILGSAFDECDVAYRVSSRFLALTIRFAPGAFDAAARDRVAFWSARAGGRASAVAALSPRAHQSLRAQLDSCELGARGLRAGTLFEAAGRIFSQAGAPADRPRTAQERPLLAMDVGGPGWEGASYSPEENTLFVAAPLCPPVGDEISLAFRIPGDERPVPARAIVLDARGAESAGRGKPAGYTLGIWSPPPELQAAFAKHAPRRDPEAARTAPRFHVTAPVRISTRAAARPSPPEAAGFAPPPAPRALVEYASEQELAADYVQNLSQGGAFVRTARPSPVGAPVTLDLRLPNGAELHANATVVYVRREGMGVRFVLDAENEEILSSAISQISARPRRALLVDDDALVRRMISDALAARGFEVLTASDGASGLQALSEELLALDLLVTDVRMPGMDGEAFVRTIRRAGGEAELAIVVVSGRLEEGLERRLVAAGADAVLDKALGPELIAQAADAALERKRLGAAR
ncbi:MAG TPA: response regulator [Anaeromyxobacteraceae bacterium]|nr:response regulator [Anaeromyxobacteraceae bacterium]